MFVEENRNCGCGCGYTNDTEDITPLSNNYNNNGCGCDPERTVDCDMRREMMDQIRSYDFAIVELALYLDTHPEDQRALCLHKKYCKQLKELKDKYQKVYGPLTINYPCNKWRWLEEPMPWERGNY